jgi:hypothetical protein
MTRCVDELDFIILHVLVADRPRRGRPRVMTPRQDRAIQLAHLRNHHVTATETALITVGNRKLNSPVLTWRHYARTSPSRTVGNPSSISQTTDKTFYGGNIHTKL